MSTLKCKECGHDNEIQRVYCHNCGERLDRTSLVEEAKKNPKKIVKQKSSRQASGSSIKVVKTFLKTTLLALVTAGLVQAVRPPSDAPVEEKVLGGDIVDAPSLSIELDEASVSPRRFSYSGAQLNAYLKNRIKPPKNPPVPVWAMTFKLAYVHLQQGSFRITKEFLFLSLPIHLGGTYVPSVGPEGFKVRPLAGHIGRLPINGVIYDLVDNFIFADFVKNMDEEARSAAKMRSFEVKPNLVVITSGGPKK